MADAKISDLTAQTTLHDADLGVGVDTTDTTQAATGTTKKWTWTTAKSFLKTYFDTLYLGLHATADTVTTNANLTGPITSVGNATTVGLTAFSNLNAPEGFLINGKFSPSVSSNNLTVAIKGIDGNDPSATNPVYCRINGVIRSITSTLSVTKNAGTNWFNSGSAELATKEIDYFVYLGFNATDGVTIGFSRIPYANSYGDFNTTTTNEKYCAISTITNASSADYYNVIGRFAATLSAGAGYTWSVPTYTAINLIQRPIYDTRYLIFSPSITSGTGSITTLGTVSGSYQIYGRNCKILISIIITTNGTAAGAIISTLPLSSSEVIQIVGRENASTGNMLQGHIQASNSITIYTYNNTYPGGTGYNDIIGGNFRIG